MSITDTFYRDKKKVARLPVRTRSAGLYCITEVRRKHRMPGVLTTPETVRVARRQQDVPGPAAVAPCPTSQRPWARLMARIAALRPGTRQRPVRLSRWSENAPRPTEAPMERLAREFPQLFLLAHCG
jgi:hypothetical protein